MSQTHSVDAILSLFDQADRLLLCDRNYLQAVSILPTCIAFLQSALYSEVLKMEPGNLFAINSLYECKRQLGDVKGAHDLIKAAISKLQGDDLDTCFNYGVSCLDNAEYEESCKYLIKALAIVEEQEIKEKILFNIGIAYEKQLKIKEA